MIAAAGCARFLVSEVTPLRVALAAVFGLAAAASGNRLGSALRALRAPSKRQRAALACALATSMAETGLVVISASLLSGSLLAGAGLAIVTIVAATISHATRIRDAEMEARAAVRAQARIRLDAAEHAAGRAVDAVRAAHAADLARLALAMDHSDNRSANARERDVADVEEWDQVEEPASDNEPARRMAA